MLSAKHIKAYERKYVGIMNEHHFAQRIAGSGCGKHSVCDIISVEDGEVFLDELKSTSADKLVLDSKTKEQLQKMMDKAKKHPPLKARLVIHWKGVDGRQYLWIRCPRVRYGIIRNNRK